MANDVRVYELVKAIEAAEADCDEDAILAATKALMDHNTRCRDTLIGRLEALTEAQEVVYKCEREDGASIVSALYTAERIK